MAQIIVNPQTGERMVQLGGQWVPLAPPQAAGLPPPGAAPAQPPQAEGGLPAPGEQSTLGIAGRAAYQAAVPATVDAASGVMHMLGTGLVGVGQRDLGASLIGKSKAVEATAEDLAGAVAQPQGAKTIADAWQTNDWSGYLANTIGMAAGSTAPMALAAGATAVTGGAAIPAVIAAGLTSWAQQAGSMFNELRKSNVPLEKAATWSGLSAVPQAVLDVTGLSKIPGLRQAVIGLRKAGLDGEAKNVFNRMFRETVKGAGAEMVTEAGQGAIGEGVKAGTIPGYQFDVASVAEQGAAGFIGGGALGGPGAVAEALAKPAQKKIPPKTTEPPAEANGPNGPNGTDAGTPPVPQAKPTVEWQPVYDEETESTVVAYVNPVTGETRTPEQHQAPIPTPLSGLPPQIETPPPGEVTATLTPDTVAREDMPAGPAPPVQTSPDLSAANSGAPASNSEQAAAEPAPAPVTLPEAMALTPDRVARETMPAGPPPALIPDRVAREDMPAGPPSVLSPDRVTREEMPAPVVQPTPQEKPASRVQEAPSREGRPGATLKPYEAGALYKRAAPVNDLADKPTGWRRVDGETGSVILISPKGETRVFTGGYPYAGTYAHAYAIDNPIEAEPPAPVPPGEIVVKKLFGAEPAQPVAPAPVEEVASGVSPTTEAASSTDPSGTPAGWVIVDKATSRPVLETFDKEVANKVNREKYESVPAQEYLQTVAKRVKEAGGVQPPDMPWSAPAAAKPVPEQPAAPVPEVPTAPTPIPAGTPIRVSTANGKTRFDGTMQAVEGNYAVVTDDKGKKRRMPLKTTRIEAKAEAPAKAAKPAATPAKAEPTPAPAAEAPAEPAAADEAPEPAAKAAPEKVAEDDGWTAQGDRFVRWTKQGAPVELSPDSGGKWRLLVDGPAFQRVFPSLAEAKAGWKAAVKERDAEQKASRDKTAAAEAERKRLSDIRGKAMEPQTPPPAERPKPSTVIRAEDYGYKPTDLGAAKYPAERKLGSTGQGAEALQSALDRMSANRLEPALTKEQKAAADEADARAAKQFEAAIEAARSAKPDADFVEATKEWEDGAERYARSKAPSSAKEAKQFIAGFKEGVAGRNASTSDAMYAKKGYATGANWLKSNPKPARPSIIVELKSATGKTTRYELEPDPEQIAKVAKQYAGLGRGAKYQRGEGGPDEADLDEARGFLVELAQVDPLFRYARSEKATLQGVLRDVAPDLWYVGDETSFDGQEETGAERRHLVRTSRNNKDAYIFERPGEVWIDVSRLDPGEAGASIYAAVANYAHNNRLKFIGDPMGLSDVALRRRTDQMLSSALKFGTTRHLEPHQRQLDGDPSLGVPPLRWTEGDDAGNVRALIDVSLRNLLHHVPELARARFDASSGTFRTGEGKPLTDGKLRGWVAKYPRIRAASAGSATLKRGILLNTLVRGGSEERSGLLDRVLRQPRQLVEGGQLKRTFYRREAEPAAKAPDAATVHRTLRDLLNRIAGTKVGLDVNGDLTDEQGNPVEGRYWRNLISVALDAANAEGTARHEAIHFLKEVGAFPPAIWQALEKQAATWRKQYRIDQRYDGLSEAELNEEAIAEAYAKWSKDPKKVDAALGARVGFNRIQKILTAIRDALRRLFGRMPTADEVFARVERGEFATDGEGKAGGKAKAQKDGADLDMSYGARMERARAMGFDVWTTVYHGSPDLRGILDGFKTLKERYGQEDPSRAFFFADDPRVARTYADPRRAFDYQGSEPGVISAYLKMTNPKVIDWGGGQWRGTDKAIHDAKAEGHDGVIIRNVVDDYNLKGKKPTTVRVVFSPEQIRSTDAAFAPKDADKPNIKYDRGDAGYLVENNVAETMEELDKQNYSLLQKVVPDKYKGEVGAAIDRARHLFQDRMIHSLRVQEATERVLGKPLPEWMQPYLVEEGYDSRVGEQKFRVDMDFKQPILELMKAGKLTQEQVDKYLTARHAKERNEYIASINPKLPDAGSGMSTAKAKAILAEGTPELEQIGALVDQMMKQRLDFLVETGELSPGAVAAMRSRYEHYVPLRGVEEGDNEPEVIRPLTGPGFKGSRANDKRATGRFSEAPDVLATAFILADEAIIRGQKNIVRKAFYDLFQAAPDPAIAEIEPVETKAVMRKIPYKVTENGKTVTRYRQEVDYRQQKVTAPRDGMIVRIDGQPVIVRINHKPLLNEIERLGGQEVNALVRGMASVTQKLSMLNTMWNPEFLFTNAFRDIETGLVNIGKEKVAGIRSQIMKNWVSALKGAWHYQHTGKADTAWSKKMQEFREAGGAVAFNEITDVKQMQRSIDEQIAAFSTGKMAKINQARKKLFGIIENANSSVDNAMRLSVYSALRDAGYSKAQAASVSKNLTVNFNRRGELGSAMNALFMFYNAATQGTAVMLSAMKRPAVRRFVMATVGLGVAQELLSSMLSQPPDDDEDGLGLSPYDRIPEYEKQRNIIILIPPFGPGDYVKIPLFYGYGWFHNIGRLGAAYARGAKQLDGKPRTLGATAADIGTSFVQNIVPPGLSNLFVPTVATPFVELAQNKNFFDSPIKPVRYPNDNSPESQRYFPNVNPISREVAQFLNAMTGGDEFTPGLVDISPEAISHVADVYAGAAGAAVVNGWSAIMRTAGEATGTNTEDPKLGVRDIPFARKLLGSEGFGQAKDATYRRIDALEGLAEREKVYSGKAEPDRRDPKALSTLRREHGRELALVPEARKLRRELSAIRKERLAILGSQMPAREQRAKTDVLAEREKRLMRAFNQRYMRAIPAA